MSTANEVKADVDVLKALHPELWGAGIAAE
jgi:hypothetical protein